MEIDGGRSAHQLLDLAGDQVPGPRGVQVAMFLALAASIIGVGPRVTAIDANQQGRGLPNVVA